VSYVATGEELYLTIGDFKDPSLEENSKKRQKRVKRLVPFNPEAYYVRVFFDDISIEPASEDGFCQRDSIVLVTDSVVTDSLFRSVSDTFHVGERVILRNIYFDFDSASLKPESFAELDKLTGLLRSYPTLRIKINGHTDEKGTAEYNLDLSNRRAQSVVNYLVATGIDARRLSSEGFGEAQPISGDDSVNRRVEFEVIGL
jgi:outer membrane protein OmpA-like peptidoglycan-associated protein